MKNTATVIVFNDDRYNSMFEVLFLDLLNEEDTFCVVEKPFPHPFFYQKLLALNLRLIARVYEKWASRRFLLPKKVRELSKTYENVRILFHNVSLRGPNYPLCVFSSVRRYHATFNMLYLDKHDHLEVCSYANELCDKKVFDRVFTFDPEDAEKYGIPYTPTPYSELPEEEQIVRNDLYYCGAGFDRAYQLYKVSEAAKANGVTPRLDLSGCDAVKEFFDEFPQVFFHKEFVAYPEVVKNVQQSRCVLDITRKGQTGLTLRPYEAVVYNKKLLTNNPAIKNFSYYDPRYMQYFEKPEDIDWEWLKAPATVDYGYRGEFSPVEFAKKMI